MTTINEALTPLGNGFRNLYRTNDKYSAADMAKLLSGLEIHNFLDDSQYFDSKVDNNGKYPWKVLTGIDVDKWNKYLVGKTVIFSFDAEWSGFVSNNDYQNRLGFELQTTAEDGTQHWNGSWLYLNTESGKQYCATRMTIYDKPIKSIDYANIYNQINTDATVKITNVKVYIDPLGGVAPLGLVNPDMSTWEHQGIQIISQDGYQVAVLPPTPDDTKQLITHSSWEQGKTYRWTFEAKAAQPGGTIHTEMWGGGGFLTIKLTEEWKEYSSIGKPDPRYNMFYFWNVYDTGNIYLRNVKIYEA